MQFQQTDKELRDELARLSRSELEAIWSAEQDPARRSKRQRMAFEHWEARILEPED